MSGIPVDANEVAQVIQQDIDNHPDSVSHNARLGAVFSLHLIPGPGHYKDLPFIIKDRHEVYMLDRPGHHEDIIRAMHENWDKDEFGVPRGSLISGQFYYDGPDSPLKWTFFGFEEYDFDQWAEMMVPKLEEQGASYDSFNIGDFHYVKHFVPTPTDQQLTLPGSKRWF